MRKEILITIFSIFISTGSTLAQPRITDQIPSCIASVEYNTQTTVFIIDKTSNLTTSQRQDWKTHTAELLNNFEATGKIYTAEVKDSGVSYLISMSYCFPSQTPPPGIRSDPEENVHTILSSPLSLSKVISYVILKIEELIKPVIDYLFGSSEAADAVKRTNYFRQVVQDRALVLDTVSSLADGGVETKTTDIIDPLFQLISYKCPGSTVCHLFIFSDMIDTAVKRRLTIRGARPTAIADADFEEKLREYHPDIKQTRIQINAWGIGHDEANAANAAQASERKNLRSYWNQMLSRICNYSANGSSISLSDIFSYPSPRGCQ